MCLGEACEHAGGSPWDPGWLPGVGGGRGRGPWEGVPALGTWAGGIMSAVCFDAFTKSYTARRTQHAQPPTPPTKNGM